MRRSCLVMALAAVLLLPATPATASEAPAPGDNRGWTDGAGVGAKADTGSITPTNSGGKPSGSGPTCSYRALTAQESSVAEAMEQAGAAPAKSAGAGNWVRKVCVDENGNSTGTVVWSPQRAPVDPVALARQALNYSALPSPALGMSPSSDRDQLVNVPTWLWIDPTAWRPISANASAGGITVTTSAKPARVVWDPGDGGSPITCDGPGTPYNPSHPSATPTCSYTYRSPAERAVVTATVEWSARWTSSAGGGGDLGVVRRSSSVPVRVAESQAINVSAAGRPS